MAEDTGQGHNNDKKGVEIPGSNWCYPPFDDTTNFSILGWFWGKAEFNAEDKERVDFNLEE